MTPRERVLTSIGHNHPDFVPYHIGYTIPTRDKLIAHFHTDDLDTVLDNHIVKYRLRLPDVEVTPGYWRDGFGLIWNRTIDQDIGMVEDFPLKERSLKGATFPDPKDSRIYQGLPAFIERNRDRFRMASVGFSLYERSWSLRSMPELLVDMLEAPSFVEELMDAITDNQLAVLEQALQYDLDGILFGDDWGQQTGLIFGGRLWRKFIKPRMARMFAAVKKAGKVVMLHSCGKVQELFPDLIEIGLDVFNPFQPEVMDVFEMKRRFGQDLAFYGGVSIQKTLPYGTPAEVRDETIRLIRELGPGGGFILSPSHAMPGDIPIENILAMHEVVSNQALY